MKYVFYFSADNTAMPISKMETPLSFKTFGESRFLYSTKYPHSYATGERNVSFETRHSIIKVKVMDFHLPSKFRVFLGNEQYGSFFRITNDSDTLHKTGANRTYFMDVNFRLETRNSVNTSKWRGVLLELTCKY